jgi:hypothetical protein
VAQSLGVVVAVALLPVSVPELDFELRKDGDAEVIARTAASVAQTELDRRKVAEGQIPLQGLGPGSYTISAVISEGNDSRRQSQPHHRDHSSLSDIQGLGMKSCSHRLIA